MTDTDYLTLEALEREVPGTLAWATAQERVPVVPIPVAA